MKTTKSILLLTLILAVCLSCSSGGSQKQTTETEETVPEMPPVPDGFEVMQSDTLSLAGETFVINALRYEDEASMAQDNPDLIRPLTILRKTTNAGYQLIARNDSVILCMECGGVFGDPWDGIYTEESSFTVSHMGGSSSRWTRNIKFQYNIAKKAWFLAEDRGASFSTLDPENSFEMTIYTPGDSLGLVPFEAFKTEF